MNAPETAWVKLPDGLLVKAIIGTRKAGVAGITIVTRHGDDIHGSFTGGQCTRRSSHSWDVLLCRRPADLRDCETDTTPTLWELAPRLEARLRERGAWWQ